MKNRAKRLAAFDPAFGGAAERVVLTPKGHALLNDQHRARAQNNKPRPAPRNQPQRR